MKTSSAVIREALQHYQSFESPLGERQFLCIIIAHHFPRAEAEEAVTLIQEALEPYNSLAVMLCHKAADYPCFYESDAFEYRYQWWLRFIAHLESKGL